MRDHLARMLALSDEGRPFVVATVVRTQGSTPQVAGAKLILDDRDRIDGTLGGGCVEGDAVLEARRILADGGSSLKAYDLTEPLAWDTGLVCGGTMWIYIERGEALLQGDVGTTLAGALGPSSQPIALTTELLIEGRHVAATGHRVIDRASASLMEVDERARRALADAFDGGVARTVSLGHGHEALVEPILARPRLVIAGGGHVAFAIASMARLLDYTITVIDDREDFANAVRFPGVEVIQDQIAETLVRLDLDWNTFIVIATRGHKMDAHCVRSAIATPARYVGLLGSRRKTILIENMLRDEGATDAQLRAVHAPIGLDLGGRTPAEIALAVLAEMSQERYGGSGRPLRLSDERREPARQRKD
jgi:xanthine dehydrogenase accessory factor